MKKLTPYEQWMVKSNLQTIADGTPTSELLETLKANGYPQIAAGVAKSRLEYLRGELRAERISYGELCELQCLSPHIEPGDVELLEPAGVPESEAYKPKNKRKMKP